MKKEAFDSKFVKPSYNEQEYEAKTRVRITNLSGQGHYWKDVNSKDIS